MTYGEGSLGPGSPGSILGAGASRVRHLNTGTISASKQLTTLPGRLLGWALEETTGTASAKCRLHDGTDANGDVADRMQVGTGATAHISYFDVGVDIQSGLWVEVVSGSLSLTVYYQMDVSGNA
jgi:hypothetical protein